MFTYRGQTLAYVSDARDFEKALALPGAALSTCTWWVERVAFDFDDLPMAVTEDCGAPSVEHDDGFVCLAGHEHTSMEAAWRQGFGYAEDAYDAAVITAGGRDVRPMGARTHIDPAEVAHVRAGLGI